MFKLFERMLPRGGEAFRLPYNGPLRAFIDGLSVWFDQWREYIDMAWFYGDPWLSPELDRLESDLGLVPSPALSPFQRRERIAAAMASDRTQAAQGVQELIRAQGFDVYLYDSFRNLPAIGNTGGGIRVFGTVYDSTVGYPAFKFRWTGTLFNNAPILSQWYSDGNYGAAPELALYTASMGGSITAVYRGVTQAVMYPDTVVDDGLIHRWEVEFTGTNGYSWKVRRDGELVASNPANVSGTFTRYITSTTFGYEALDPSGVVSSGGAVTMGDLYFEQDGNPVIDVKGDQKASPGPNDLINRVRDGPLGTTTVRYYYTQFNLFDTTPPVYTLYPGVQSFSAPVAPNPADYLAPATNVEPEPDQGYPLVNAIRETTRKDIGMGDDQMNMGDEGSAMGEYSAYAETRRVYRLPSDPSTWGAICYVGGAVWPQLAQVPASRRDEFEALVLRHLPAHIWAGMMVEYV